MQFYDLAMLAVLVGATLFGAWKGMAWQLASLGSLVASYFVALNFSSLLAPLFGKQAPWNRYYAMLALYLGTSAVVWLAFRVVADVIDRVKLKEFDRQVGGLVGAAKGVLLCVVITFFAVSLLPGSRDRIVNSRSGYYIARLLDRADAVMPREMNEVLGPYLDKVQEQLGGQSETASTSPAEPLLDPADVGSSALAAFPAFTTPEIRQALGPLLGKVQEQLVGTAATPTVPPASPAAPAANAVASPFVTFPAVALPPITEPPALATTPQPATAFSTPAPAASVPAPNVPAPSFVTFPASTSPAGRPPAAVPATAANASAPAFGTSPAATAPSVRPPAAAPPTVASASAPAFGPFPPATSPAARPPAVASPSAAAPAFVNLPSAQPAVAPQTPVAEGEKYIIARVPKKRRRWRDP